tara:strand:+ start:1463 stop:1837 length:375 start_codon:yes stop_codon:yes gene_type:complete
MITALNTDTYKATLQDNDIQTFFYDDKYDGLVANATIEWSLDMEHRSWGIKGFFLNIHSIDLNINYYNDEEDFTTNYIYLNSDEEKFGFQVETQSDEMDLDTGSVAISDLEINFQDKIVTVIFG